MTAEPTTDIALSNHDFTLPSRSHVQATLQQVEEFRALIHSELREGPDYGTIPGTSKPTLLKPGAEKIAKLLGLADTYEITDKTADWEKGLFQYEVRCSLVSIRTGQIISQGVGECNSYESKYRYRDAKRKCPECGAEAIIKGKVEYGGGWVCFGKIGGCGAKWGDGASVIESQTIGRVLNEDPADQVNTILKMAKKRCLGSTTPVLFKTNRSVSRSNLSKMFDIWEKSPHPLYLPGVDGTWRKVKGMIREEGRQVVRIDLADGSHIRATPEHRFPTSRGLVEVSDLQVGDSLLRSQLLDTQMEGRSAEPTFGYVAGLFLADGNNGTATSVEFTLNAERPELAEAVSSAARMVGATVSTKVRPGTKARDVDIYGTSFTGLIHQFVHGDSAHDKHLSRWTWSQGRTFLQTFLSGYLNGDGHWYDRRGRQPHWILGFSGRNHELAHDLRTLGTMLDYRTSLKRVHEPHLFGGKPCYTGWMKPSSPKYNGKILEQIVAITPETKPAVVYDVEVDGDHLFCLANGIQTHNSLTDAALSVGSLSNLFTQDLEDMPSPPQPTQAPQAGAASSPAETPPPQTASSASNGSPAASQAASGAPNGSPTRFTTMGDFMAWANGKHGKTGQDVVNLARQLYPNEEIGNVTDLAQHKDDPKLIAAVQGARA